MPDFLWQGLAIPILCWKPVQNAIIPQHSSEIKLKMLNILTAKLLFYIEVSALVQMFNISAYLITTILTNFTAV